MVDSSAKSSGGVLPPSPEPHWRPRIFQAPPGSYFLFGPRGCGKSHWLRHLHPDATWFDLLDEGLYQRLLVEPGRFGEQLEALPDGAMVVVDEAQRLPNLLNVVHQKIESKRLRFALCGSSARKLRRSGVNLLAGRAVQRMLHPFVPEELGGSFDLERTLRDGALPLVWASPDPGDTLRAYVQTYLKEEIQAEAATRNLAGFARFLPVAALFHGQVINISAVARDAGVARSTVQGYLEILESTLFTFMVPAHAARLRVRERKNPKFYWTDPGIVGAVAATAGGEISLGARFEGWIAQLLRAYRDYRGHDGGIDSISYWAPAESRKTEVDFLVVCGDSSIAIEAKASARLHQEDFRGLRAIAELPGVRRRMLVYTGSDERRTEDGIEILPVARFLEVLRVGLRDR